MPGIIDETGPLLEHIRALRDAPPAWAEPWKADEVLALVEASARYYPDRGAVFDSFVQGARGLLEDLEGGAGEQADRIIARFSAAALGGEPRVMADDPATRDHLAHVVLVYLTGWLILNKCPAFATAADWRPYGWPGEPRARLRLLNEAWLLTALLHDVGYSIQKAATAFRHELRVLGLFDELYLTGRPGRSAGPDALGKAARPLWRQRAEWIGSAALPAHEVDALLAKAYEIPSHAIVGAVALWREAGRAVDALACLLRPAALAVACHENRHLVTRELPPEAPRNIWARLDMAEEPLAALLHVCDEIQEWSRERADEAVGRRQAVRPWSYAGTELRSLEVPPGPGVVVEVRMRRRLRPEDRGRQSAVARHQERDNAALSRELSLLLEPRSCPARLKPHVRIEYLVEDEPCRNLVAVGWTSRGAAGAIGLKPPEPGGQSSSNVLSHVWADLETAPSGPAPRGLRLALHGGTADLTVDAGAVGPGARCALVAPGGGGKSTLLRHVPREPRPRRGPAHAYYVEELPQRPASLTDAAIDLRDGDEDVVLLIDHLDRLVDQPWGEFWIEELQRLPAEPWLHVVVACRPEEYDRYLEGALRRCFRTTRLGGPPALLAGGRADSSGRALADAIEDLIGTDSPEELWALAALAHGAGTARLVQWPEPAELGVRFGDSRALISRAEGGARFVHDSVQDCLSALWLAHELAGAEGDSERAARLVASFQQLPRDVPRLLLGLLARARGRHLGGDERRRASCSFAAGLLRAPATHRWLYDTGRLEQADEALEAFGRQRDGSGVERLVAAGALGLNAFGRFRGGKIAREDLEHAEQVVIQESTAACEAEAVLAATSSEARSDEAWACKALIGHAADHMTRVVGQVFLTASHRTEARRLAQLAADRLAHGTPGSPLEPGWLASITAKLARAASSSEVLRLLEAVDADMSEASKGPGGRWLAVRRAVHAGHIGNFLVDLAGHEAPSWALLETAARWYRAAASRREGIIRGMDGSSGRDREQGFASVGLALADLAVQHRGVVQAHLFAHRVEGRPRRLAVQLLEAHGEHERAWARAETALASGERLPIHYRPALATLAVGRVLEKQMTAARVTHDAVAAQLEAEAEALLLDYPARAERHPRYDDGKDAVEKFYTFHEERLGGDLVGTILELAEEARGTWAQP